MDRDDKQSSSKMGRYFNYANNLITIFGAILATLSSVLIIILMITEFIAGLENPYTSILSYMILPLLFLIGLIAIPIGIWRRRRLLLASGTSQEEIGRYPRFDFNDPHLRRLAAVVLGLTGINAIIFGSSTYFAIHYMESVKFCGTVCHTVMKPEYTAYGGSPHSRVRCVECHIGPGAPWFVRSKVDGLRQVWRTALDIYAKPIQTPIHNLRPAKETCEQCHWPKMHHGDKLRVFARFGTDEANTPSYSAMLLKTGGGGFDFGRYGGIHWWHIFSDNRIRYVADESRQEITWVELTTPTGEVRSYTRDEDEPPSAEQIQTDARVMDCVDCHNRPTHLFPIPSYALDELFQNRPELLELPYFKRESLRAIKAKYPTHESGLEGVRQALLDFYRGEYPELAAQRPEIVKLGVQSAAEIYGRSVFPEMNVNWDTHPNNLGHEDFPGCFRCHDDELATADGEHVIPQDCDTCHTFLVEDSPTPPDLGIEAE